MKESDAIKPPHPSLSPEDGGEECSLEGLLLLLRTSIIAKLQ
jgi:hypothetical protein